MTTSSLSLPHDLEAGATVNNTRSRLRTPRTPHVARPTAGSHTWVEGRELPRPKLAERELVVPPKRQTKRHQQRVAPESSNEWPALPLSAKQRTSKSRARPQCSCPESLHLSHPRNATWSPPKNERPNPTLNAAPSKRTQQSRRAPLPPLRASHWTWERAERPGG